MKKTIMTMVALLSMTAIQAQDNNQGTQQMTTAQPRNLMLTGDQRVKVMELKGETPEQMTERMAKALSLTDEQKAKVFELNKEYQDVLSQDPRMGAMRPHRLQANRDSVATPQQRQRPQVTEEQRAEMKQKAERRKEYNEKVKTVLTEEQYKKFQGMQMRRTPRRGHAASNRHGASRGPRPVRQSQTPTE